jgi:hemoglobin
MSETLNHVERRAGISLEIKSRTGIDELMIEHLVQCFYEKIRKDVMLGPIFARQVTDWEQHLQRMCEFWSSVALMTGRYHGRPMAKHLPLPVDSVHFDRWLELFVETTKEVCPPAAAIHFIVRAKRIAESLELGIAGQQGILLDRGERFRIDSLINQ